MLNEDLQMVIAGLGGQGVILLTRVLGEWALLEDYRVLATETHGMATRGGSVISHVKLGNHHFPLIMKGNAHVAMVLAPSEKEQAQAYLAPQGLLMLNGEGPRDERVWALEADKLASKKLGNPLFANLIMLGALGKKVLDTPKERLTEALKKVTGERHIQENCRALDLGYEEA